MRFLLLALLLLPGLAYAAHGRERVPNAELKALAAQLDTTEAALAEIRSKLESQRARFGSEDKKLRQMTHNLVQMGGYPEGLLLARGVLQGEPGAASAMAVMVRQQAKQLVDLGGKVKGLEDLYQQSNAKVAQLRALNESYQQARGRLSKQEKLALQQATLDAGDLAERLHQAVKVKPGEIESLDLVPENLEVAASPVLLPLSGKVVQGFKVGKGATAEGVVLQGAPHATVVASVAGKVIYSGPFRQFGGLVIVKTEKGEDVLYGGLTELNVETGAQVNAADVLGKVGEDGRVYWEWRQRGVTRNPLAMR